MRAAQDSQGLDVGLNCVDGPRFGLRRMRRRQPRAAGCEHGRQRSVCKKASFKRKNNGVRQKQKNLLSCRRACRYDFTLYMAPLVKYAHSDFTL